MEKENKSKFNFVKKIFGFKQCDCLDKKIPKVKKENEKSCCCKKDKKC